MRTLALLLALSGCKPTCDDVERGIRTGAPGWQARAEKRLDCVPRILRTLNAHYAAERAEGDARELEARVQEKRRLLWVAERFAEVHAPEALAHDTD